MEHTFTFESTEDDGMVIINSPYIEDDNMVIINSPLDAEDVRPIDWDAIEPALWASQIELSSRDGFQAMHLRFNVPLDHRTPRDSRTSGELIELHADLVFGPGPPVFSPGNVPCLEDILSSLLPPAPTAPAIVVYLCGGPGDANSAFALPALNKNILKRGCPVLYLDYRGTGRSTPLTPAHMASRPAQYLLHFTHDAIVADLEAVRLALRAPRWVLLGQSFGGWIAATYLAAVPRALAAVYLAGGLPPVGRTPDDVYKALYARLRRANWEYYRRYPEDRERVAEVVRVLAGVDQGKGIELPLECARERLTARGFMTLGRWFGAGAVGFEKVHAMVGMFWRDCAGGGIISEKTIQRFVDMGGTGFKLPKRPLYAVLHEAIYCEGPKVRAAWAAERVGRQLGGEHFAWLDDELDLTVDGPRNGKTHWYFSGEMIYRFMLRDAGPTLEPFIPSAQAVAGRSSWPMHYNRKQLRQNKVPMRALIYPSDLFLDPKLSMDTASMIANCMAITAPTDWVHGSIKTRTAEVLDLLFPPRNEETGLPGGLVVG